MAQSGSEELDGGRNGSPPAAEAELLHRLRQGDPEAGHRFVQEHYPSVYRYLLYLSGHRETAEDLAQETFLQAWRHLDQFQGRSSLPFWLHRIARREFLRARRRQRATVPLEEAAEGAMRDGSGWTDEVELRLLLSKLPEEQREVVFLHGLAGYSSADIARIVQAPASTIRTRLSAARIHLQRELGDGDLPYLNEPSVPMRQWAWLPLAQMHALEARLTPGNNAKKEGFSMERREFLRQAAVGAAGLMLTEAEKEVVDSRLTQKVTCAFKGTALFDLCARLRADTGVHLVAGPSVADEKVTLFCEKTPLREVMRQLSRPFGYTWLRSKEASGVRREALGEKADDTNAQRLTPNASYRYELVQDLRSQLLEEELRNRDLNAALLVLDAQMQQYRLYLDLSLEALQKQWEAGGDRLLGHIVHNGGWGGIQLYHHLTPRDRAALVSGEELTFRPDALDPDHRLPSEWSRPILQALSHRTDAEGHLIPVTVDVDGRPTLLGELPGAQVRQVRLRLNRSELGQVSLVVMIVSAFKDGQGERLGFNLRELATSRSRSAENPDNATANAAFRRQSPFDRAVTLHLEPSCPARQLVAPSRDDDLFHRVDALASPSVSSADAWEAFHRATGLPIVADFFTRLYPLDAVSTQPQPLFEALCRVSDALGMRWRKDDRFVVCRSASYFWDKLKEVPNRYLQGWVHERDAGGGLPLHAFLAMAAMTDAQLDSTRVAAGIEHCWGLREWAWLAGTSLEGKLQREHARFLATLTAEQQHRALEPPGLRFRELTPSQQQGVVRLQYLIQEALEREEGTAPPLQPEALARARITARFIPAGWYAAPPEPAGEPSSSAIDPVGGRTAAEATAAARQFYPRSAPPEVRRLRDGYFRADIRLDRD